MFSQSPDRDSHLTTEERRCTASHSKTGILLKSGFHEEIFIFSGSLTHSRYDLKITEVKATLHRVPVEVPLLSEKITTSVLFATVETDRA